MTSFDEDTEKAILVDCWLGYKLVGHCGKQYGHSSQK